MGTAFWDVTSEEFQAIADWAQGNTLSAAEQASLTAAKSNPVIVGGALLLLALVVLPLLRR